jgi:hypothetical protein
VWFIFCIVDAVVDAHLYEQRHDPDLALKPTIINDNVGIGQAKVYLSLSYRF